MKFVSILAACAAFAIVTLGVLAGQTMIGTSADAQILSQTISPFDMMKDARELPVQTIDNLV
jgi:peptidase E